MKNHRKKAIAILAGLAVTGIVGASAASLGAVTGQSLGATTDVVGSCDTDGVTVSYNTSYDALNDRIIVDDVIIGAVAAACGSLDYEVVLTGGTPATRTVLGEATGIAASPSFTASSFTDTLGVPTTIDAEDVTGIAITISG